MSRRSMRRRDMLKAMSAVPFGFSTDFRASAGPYFTAQARQYSADWNSLNARPMPPWYTDAKFGIFIHWGVYSVPAFAPVNVKDETPYAEWYWHSLTEGKTAKGPTGNGALTWAFHKRVYGADFPYFDFAPMFRAELFDPDRWADVISRSGARYVALTSKHHEGFTLWRSAEANRAWGRPWNSVDIGPKRDLVLELTEAGRRRGLRMGIYYSLYEWYNPLWLSDKKRYVAEHLFPQFKDVVTHVKPSLIFSDGEWEMTSAEWRSPELLAWLFNDSPVADEVVIDDRWGKDTRHKDGGYFTTEYTSGLQRSQHPWEESRGMGFSYGYNRMETLHDYRTNRELVLMLIDIVSRGGNLLLDIGPTADGRIPVIMEERLIEIGNWLRPNAEAIYGTHAFVRSRQWSNGTVPRMEDKQFMAAYDITKLVDAPPPGYARTEAFFTAKNDVVYAFLPRWPANQIWFEDLVPRHTAKVTLLETGDELRWQLQGSRLRVEVPESLRSKLPQREAYVFKMVGVGGP
jgi:alpha-L-fucosidase